MAKSTNPTPSARERLAALLAEHGEVASSVQLTAKSPKALAVDVRGIGGLKLPLTAAQTKKLRGLGRPARFGKGEETLVDAGVRDTWEIPRDLVDVRWVDGLDAELGLVREELGLPTGSRLTAELHSVLLYDEGQFFLPHQDSEKDDAMVATLVVTLPSAHTGGELIVHHRGEATRYRGFPDRVALVAFYADCRHEVLPVRSGSRVTITYNLLLQGGRGERPGVSSSVRELLDEHFRTSSTPRWPGDVREPPEHLAFLLDHEYSQRGLSWDRLKGADASAATALRDAAAEQGDYEAVLALGEIHERWDAWDEDPYRYYPAPDDDEGRFDENGYYLNDLIEAEHRFVLNDPSFPAGAIDLDESEVCSVTPTSAMPADSSEYEGYLGNYGNTLDRWYRRAAVVIWPREQTFVVRARSSPVWALDTLIAGRDPDVARELAPYWEGSVRSHGGDAPLLGKALEAALALDDAGLATMLLSPFTIERLGAAHMPVLAELAARHGATWSRGILDSWFGETMRRWYSPGSSREGWIGGLPELLAHLPAGERVLRQELTQRSWDSLAAMIASDLRVPQRSVRHRQLGDLGMAFGAVVRAAASLRTQTLSRSIVKRCLSYGDSFSACLMPALRDAVDRAPGQDWEPAFLDLGTAEASRLRTRLEMPERAAGDWSIGLPDGCDCELCGQLAAFLADPEQLRKDWPLAKDRRGHVHARIDAAELPVTHETRRSGRPFVLVLVKTQRLFDDERLERARDADDLGWLGRQGMG
ncbi:2OG-Fe(II) oxygenase [Kineosporia sp. J2-2]|uniref:2OG-Fe(II) oxygenase n=1 Tax=Kineosporia corallincola TaxID=2835133 RepID=A0ABS5TGP5_9ACTN|nr:2OG-Fe(II) oxygenase [Kineosporia corallincola]MBT0770269.1 2OG-Fe(II) oxygenase [Kineosporia corallincola]